MAHASLFLILFISEDKILKVNEEGTPQKHKTATKCDVSLFKIKFQYKLGLIQQHSAVF